MKIKRQEILKLESAFNSLMETKLEPDTAFKVAHNGIVASASAESIRKAYKPVDGYDKYTKARKSILEDANAIFSQDGSIQIKPDKVKEVRDKIADLDGNYEVILGIQKEYDKKFNLALEKEVSVDLEKIYRKELPAEGIEPAKLVPLMMAGILINGDKT